jgi:hypothetical protein
MELTRSQKLLLDAIRRHNGEWNWYQLGRAMLAKLDSPEDFTLQPLLDGGLVEECVVPGEPISRLVITIDGERALGTKGTEDGCGVVS